VWTSEIWKDTQKEAIVRATPHIVDFSVVVLLLYTSKYSCLRMQLEHVGCISDNVVLSSGNR
jgi:hypothetical protein